MDWHLVHTDVEAQPDSKITSKSYIVIEKDGTKIEIGKMLTAEDHILGTKRALVDTAFKLQDLARQMLKKADSFK